MTREQKDLLLKDLCARLPYRVIVDYAHNAFDVHKGHYVKQGSKNILNCYLLDTFISPRQNEQGEYIKPYLFPLSSMTVEQRCKVQNLLPNHCDISFKNQKITFYDEGNILQLEQLEKVFNFFNMHHIDYRGLIPMGLANDATGLNIY